MAMRRPVLVVSLAASVVALVASAAVAGSTLSGPVAGDQAQGQDGGMMGGPGQGYADMVGGLGGRPASGTPGRSMTVPNGSMTGGSMMGSTGMGSTGMIWLPGDGAAVTAIPAARARAATAAKTAGLHPGEVMWFDNGFYVELKDRAGKPATEVIVDPGTGSVSTEPGPAMMWNTRFEMLREARDAARPADPAKARRIATSWLAAHRPGTTILSLDSYPGYVTLDLQRNGVVSGMMSVSSGTGAVWYHAWHGAFIAMEDS